MRAPRLALPAGLLTLLLVVPAGAQAQSAAKTQRLTPSRAERTALTYLGASRAASAQCATSELRKAPRALTPAIRRRASRFLLGGAARDGAAVEQLTRRAGWPSSGWQTASTLPGASSGCSVARAEARVALYLRHFATLQRARKARGARVHLRTQTVRRPAGGCEQRVAVAARPGSKDLARDLRRVLAKWRWRNAAGCTPAPAAAAAPVLWQGVLVPKGRTTQQTPYTVAIDLARGTVGPGGHSKYVEPNCGGVLAFVSRSGATFTFTERMTYGLENCITGGTVTLTIADDGLHYAYSSQFGPGDQGVLRRTD